MKSWQLNVPLVWITLALCAIGLVNLYSASANLAQEGASPLFYSQLLWMGLGLVVCLVVWRIDYHELERMAMPLYVLSLLGLVAVLVLGAQIAGHQSWIKIGSFHLQPSEFAKVAYLLALAKYFSDQAWARPLGLAELRIPLLLVALPLLLILVEGDLGGTLFFMLTFASLVLFVGVRWRLLLSLVVIGVLVVFVAYSFLLSPYQRSRLLTFASPDLDPKGQGYQVIQSKIAVGSGEVWGKGYMRGMQNKLHYLPEKHTDFIFPVLAEEWGFVGSTVLMLLYMSLIATGVRIAAKARDRFGLFLALGISSLLFWQIVINLGGVLGLLPLTGVTLPLLSYGGSSLLTVFFGIGILLNVQRSRYFFDTQR